MSALYYTKTLCWICLNSSSLKQPTVHGYTCRSTPVLGHIILISISSVIVRVFALNAVDREFESRSCQDSLNLYATLRKGNYFANYGLRVMMFNATFNTISVISKRSVLLEEETEVPGENHWPADKSRFMRVGFTTIYAISAYRHYCIFTRYLPTGRWKQIIKKDPRGWIAQIPDLGNR
jgi:hypothetical protein